MWKIISLSNYAGGNDMSMDEQKCKLENWFRTLFILSFGLTFDGIIKGHFLEFPFDGPAQLTQNIRLIGDAK